MEARSHEKLYGPATQARLGYEFILNTITFSCCRGIFCMRKPVPYRNSVRGLIRGESIRLSHKRSWNFLSLEI